MRIVLVLKPYAIEVYSREHDVYTLLSVERTSQIEDESLSDYEKRMVFVCKDMCMEMRSSTYFKEVAHNIKGIDIVLSSPWCTYDVMHVEKDFGKKTKITDAVVASMFVKKDQKQLYVVESYVSNMLLNGYKVESIQGQYAQEVQFQYTHVYAEQSFIVPLIKTMETIFHTHKVSVTSIYGLVEYISAHRPEKKKSELQIILEEESIDISYVYDGLHVLNMFIPYSYGQIENTIAMKLSTDHTIVREILVSRGVSTQQSDDASGSAQVKHAKHIWPDLDSEVKKTIDTIIQEHTEKILQHIRDYIDTIDLDYIRTNSSLYIYAVHRDIVSAYGLELAHHIAVDPYISLKLPVHVETDSVISIF
jgi:hypothetical protein